MAVRKFGRNYKLYVGTENGELLTIEPPFTISFDIIRNVLTSANVCQIKIYNLKEANRTRIWLDFTSYNRFRPVILQAGYGDNLATIFSGNVSQCWSVREGVNFITQIECYDGGFGFVNGNSARTFPAGTTQETIIKSLISDLPDVSFGAIGPSFISANGQLIKTTRGTTYNGPTVDILNEITGRAFFVDNRKAFVLGENECRQNDYFVINADSGLIGTPIREQTQINFEMLFEPQLDIGQLVKIESSTQKSFNGFYKLISLKHTGMISESVCGEVITTGGFFAGVEGLVTVTKQ